MSEGRSLLTCWKEIAKFFGKGVRTVQRWEKDMGMPVHRPGTDRNVVFADPDELKKWALSQGRAGNVDSNDSSYSRSD